MSREKRGAGTRWRDVLLRVSLVVTTGYAACSGTDPGPVSASIALHAGTGVATPGHISVDGLSAADLSSLRGRLGTAAEWSPLLNVTVAADAAASSGSTGPTIPDVLGRYAVTDSAVTFTPLFPFDPGRVYRVVFDPSALPRPRPDARVTATVQIPKVATESTTMVTAVHPSSDIVPENLLRVYIEFSAPMGSAGGLDFVRLIELSGPEGRTERADPGAFLPVEANFWSPDHTRYTLFFDPGRVKDDILPNRERGRPLRAGRRYAIDIAPSWLDANGLPLQKGFRHVFRVGPAADEALAPSAWTLDVPAVGTRAPLTVAFPRPLDHGIVVRALSVETNDRRNVDGRVSVAARDTVWMFTPDMPWQGGEYSLVAQTFLEDPQGNQIGRAFEVSADETIRDGKEEVPARRPFVIPHAR